MEISIKITKFDGTVETVKSDTEEDKCKIKRNKKS